MPLIVSEELCNACGTCVEICPMDAIRFKEEADSARSDGATKKIPYMMYDECWYCGSCEKDCPRGALTVELPFLVR